MEEQPSSNISRNWTGLVLLAAAAMGGIWWLQSPLKSSRPEHVGLPEIAGAGSLPTARLWEDPFDATYHHTLESRCDEQEGSCSLDPERNLKEPLLILPVMVTVSPFPEGAEWRVRSRVAVHSAMRVAGYVPVDDEHIGYLSLPSPPNRKTPLVRSGSHRVPFEWFRPSKTAMAASAAFQGFQPSFARILVLWCGDEWFRSSPVEGMEHLLKRLAEQCNGDSLLKDRAVRRVIGPWSSSTLRALYTELKDEGASRARNLAFYSATATADDAVLCDSAKRRGSADVSRIPIKTRCEARGIGFRNLTCPDCLLAAELLDELRLRGIDPLQNDRMVLIAEHDTFYGRALPLSFVCQAGECWTKAGLSDPDQRCASLGDPSRRVRCFTYLRGLDGKKVREKKDASGTRNAASSPTDAANRLQGDESETPEGDSQLDYVPRLAEEIALWNRQHQGALRAIGVLGSDVYDKLLLLQALKSRFPEVQFFTTDLDARLFHPRELAWTRNLIVASSYALQLHPELQSSIAPFRDSYQTAIFRAVLEAVQDGATVERCRDIDAPPPRRLEISYTGAHDLSVAPDAGIHPPRAPGKWHGAGLAVLLQGIAFLGILGIAVWQLAPFPGKLSRQLRAHWPWTAVVLAVVVGYAGLIVYSHYDPAGAPFSLFEGISIWPTQTLRLLAAVLGTGLLLYFAFTLREVQERITREFALDTGMSDGIRIDRGPSPAAPDTAGVTSDPSGRDTSAIRRYEEWGRRLAQRLLFWMRCRSSLGIASWRFGGKQDSAETPSEPVIAVDLWSEYCDRGASTARWLRCLPPAVIYFLAMLSMVGMLAFPSQPHRGSLSWSVNWLTLLASIFVFVLVTAYVIDATRLCGRLVQLLAQGATEWPSAVTRKWEKELGLSRQYLGEWLDMRFIARLTDVVGQLIWSPLLLLALLVVARNPGFASYDWPKSLFLVFGLNTCFVLGYALRLRYVARTARKTELNRLRHRLIKAEKQRNGPAEQIRELIQEIEGMREGAFAPLSAHPVVHAVLVALGGISVPALIQYLNALNY